MFKVKILIFIFCIFSISHAQENIIAEDELYIDFIYKATSTNVKSISEYIDITLIDIANYMSGEDNKTIATQDDTIKSNEIKREKYADKFFLSNKYIGTTDEPFLRMTPEVIVNSISKFDDDIRLKINLHLPLSRSKKRFKLFIENLNDDKDKSNPEIGVSYFSPLYYNIKSKYSLGIHEIDPFIRARYSTEFYFAYWDSELIQIFKYYVNDGFKEKTQIYFDTSFANLSLFRLFAERGTEDEISGMFYSSGVVMFWQPSYSRGLTLNNKVFGATKYRYTKTTKIQETSGVHNYLSSLKYRQNIFRKWLFYEIETGVNFSIVNDYEPNYSLRLSLDIFYADINKQ